MRITLISKLSDESQRKIDSLVRRVNVQTCKFSYGIDDERRKDLDNLPYHITIFGTNKEKQNEFIKLIETIKMKEIVVKINGVEIMPGNDLSYVLYLNVEDNEKLKEIQRIIRKQFPSKYYDPDIFKFHITLDIDKDYEKIKSLHDKIMEVFEPFNIEFNELSLYDYPGDIIREFKLK